MLAVEEVSGVRRVRGHRPEAWKRCKHGTRPFPAVAHEIVDAPRAASGGVTPRRLRIPALEVEHSVRSGGHCFSPRKGTLATIRRAIGRPVEFRLAREPRATPSRVRRRLRMTDVDRPRGREWSSL